MKDSLFEQYNFTQEKFPLVLKPVKITNRSGNWVNWHNSVELLFITRGNGTIWCNDSVYPISEGDLFVINSNFLHYTQTDSVLKYYCIIIDSDFLSQNGIFVEHLEYKNYIASDEAKKKFTDLIYELENENVYQVAGVRTRLLDLMIYISRFYSTEIEDILLNISSTDKNIKKAISYIHSHLTEPLTIDTLAEYVCLNKDYFSHSFKKVAGVTPVTYINKLRCYNAKKLLQTKQYSIHDVAVKFGFENDSYFSKTFKKHIGVLPSQCLKI